VNIIEAVRNAAREMYPDAPFARTEVHAS
jgi:carbon-monoxide dehydrogenase small subunit